jgi:hypothetical protein
MHAPFQHRAAEESAWHERSRASAAREHATGAATATGGLRVLEPRSGVLGAAFVGLALPLHTQAIACRNP